MLYLKALNSEDSLKEYQFLKEMPEENGFMNPYYNIDYETFIDEVITERLNTSKGLNLKEGYVPDTYYFLYDENNIVGLFKLRHYLNDALKNGSGHIGYGIHPKYRNLGYATKGLALMIDIAKHIIPEDEIYLSCNRDNYGSLKAQLNNHAYIHHADDKQFYTRIKIYKQDTHIHFEKPYLKEHLDNIVNEAINKGLTEIYILDHSHRFMEFNFLYEDIIKQNDEFSAWALKKGKESIHDYIHFINSIDRATYPIKINFGLEVCYFMHKEEQIRQVLSLFPFDFIVGSVHFIDGFGYDLKKELWEDKDVNALYLKYYYLNKEAIKARLFTHIGHIDAIKCFGYLPTIDMYDEYVSLCNVISDNPIIVENNAGIYYREYKYAYIGINDQLLEILKYNDIQLSTSSDAHKAENVGEYNYLTSLMIDKQNKILQDENILISIKDNLASVYLKKDESFIGLIEIKPYHKKDVIEFYIPFPNNSLLSEGFKLLAKNINKKEIILISNNPFLDNLALKCNMYLLYKNNGKNYYHFKH